MLRHIRRRDLLQRVDVAGTPPKVYADDPGRPRRDHLFHTGGIEVVRLGVHVAEHRRDLAVACPLEQALRHFLFAQLAFFEIFFPSFCLLSSELRLVGAVGMICYHLVIAWSAPFASGWRMGSPSRPESM